ncbi:hypothetical protein [Lacipirellula parvula]|uniref:Uncharacterized protein n=1 Tax=Lacipirellula parvula TaxID=2650471 RepID=A0A5K7X9P6_9BACT|nr:hypothetical protein [Lacipirellula parvula]BBO33454.1 hypothetical protein PLANPX_3066 [Lacipirellula parvula]
MRFDEAAARLEIELVRPDAFKAALAFACDLEDAGMSQDDLFRACDESREQHHSDADERKYDAILDVMDRITGWCHPRLKLFPDEG